MQKLRTILAMALTSLCLASAIDAPGHLGSTSSGRLAAQEVARYAGIRCQSSEVRWSDPLASVSLAGKGSQAPLLRAKAIAAAGERAGNRVKVWLIHGRAVTVAERDGGRRIARVMQLSPDGRMLITSMCRG